MLPSEITKYALADGYPALRIATDRCEATLALHGAHLTHWRPVTTAHPVIYTSPTANYREGQAIRGGVPICWPWFNAHPTAPESYPSHGVARYRFWKLESATLLDGDVHLSLVLPPDAAIREQVPFDSHLRARFILGQSCRIELETQNLSGKNMPVGGALHSYLAVSDISQIAVTGLQDTPYLDTTQSPAEDRIEECSHISIAGEVDRIYSGSRSAVTLEDPQWQRHIEVKKEGSLSTVLWNPWKQKAAALADLPDTDYQRFLCVEAANAHLDTRTLPPGESHLLATSLHITPA